MLTARTVPSLSADQMREVDRVHSRLGDCHVSPRFAWGSV